MWELFDHLLDIVESALRLLGVLLFTGVALLVCAAMMAVSLSLLGVFG